MPRDLPLANGRMLVNFDANYDLRDIYWPHVGLRNNTLGHVNHSGVWADGAFSWFDADDWQRTMVYENDTLVTQVTLVNPKLQVTINATDVVDFDRDMLIRKMRVVNNGPEREIRLFFHHDWHIEESEGANTVYYAAGPACARRLQRSVLPLRRRHYGRRQRRRAGCQADERDGDEPVGHRLQRIQRAAGHLEGCRGRRAGTQPHRAGVSG